MQRLLPVTLFAILGALAHADVPPAAKTNAATATPPAVKELKVVVHQQKDPPPAPKPPQTITVKVGTTDIKLSPPPGMVDVPKDDPLAKAAENLTPPNCVLLRSCISASALDPDHEDDPMKTSENAENDTMSTEVYYIKDQTQDIDSGVFIQFVEDIANKTAHGVLVSQYSGFDYADAQKRLDAFAKDTGLGIKQDGDVYSLGMVSRSFACVSFMAAQYFVVTYKDKSDRVQCVSVVGYLRLNKKAIVTVTSLTRGSVLQDDLRALKHQAEHYQIDLQTLNNPSVD